MFRIRIQSNQWIWIQIRIPDSDSGFGFRIRIRIPDSDSGFGFRIRIPDPGSGSRKAKIIHKNRKKKKISCTDPLVSGRDLNIRIHTKMSQIHNTGLRNADLDPEQDPEPDPNPDTDL